MRWTANLHNQCLHNTTGNDDRRNILRSARGFRLESKSSRRRRKFALVPPSLGAVASTSKPWQPPPWPQHQTQHINGRHRHNFTGTSLDAACLPEGRAPTRWPPQVCNGQRWVGGKRQDSQAVVAEGWSSPRARAPKLTRPTGRSTTDVRERDRGGAIAGVQTCLPPRDGYAHAQATRQPKA